MNEIEEAQRDALILAKHAESIGISYDGYCKACVIVYNSYIRCGGRNIEDLEQTKYGWKKKMSKKYRV